MSASQSVKLVPNRAARWRPDAQLRRRTRAGTAPCNASTPAFYGAYYSDGQLGSVVLVSVADDLICHSIPAPVPVVPVQRPIDQGEEEQKCSEEISSFHGGLNFS
jgi:hypothetical protein